MMPTSPIRPQYQHFVLAVAAPAALVMTFFAALGVYLPGDVSISRAVQSAGFPGLQTLLDAVYYTGIYPWLYILGLGIAAALVAMRQRLLAAFLVVAIIAHNSVFLIKILIERPRPSASLIDVAHHSSGFSFPSGHVMSAVLLWGFVVFASHAIQQRALRIGVQVFAAGMMVLMGLQRIYAGAHWPTDVLAAYLWGAIVLFAVAKLYEYVKARQLAPQHVVRAVAGAEA
jgi:undecaprenyl-diphosphatase